MKLENIFKKGYAYTGIFVAVVQLILNFMIAFNEDKIDIFKIIFPVIMAFGIIIYYRVLPDAINHKEQLRKKVMLHYVITALVIALYIFLNKHYQFMFILPIIFSLFIAYINYKKIMQERLTLITILLSVAMVLTNLGLLLNDLEIGKLSLLTILYIFEFLVVFLYSIYFQYKYLRTENK